MRNIIETIREFRLRQWATVAMSLLALVLAYTGVWVYGATQTVTAAEQWVGDRRAEGYTIRFDELRATGYPLWIRIDLAHPGIEFPNGEAPWGWAADSLAIAARPWRPTRVSLQTTGKQVVSFQSGDQYLTFQGSLAAATAELSFENGDPQSLEVIVRGLDLVAKQGAGIKISVADGGMILRRLAVAAEAVPGAATIALDVTSSEIEMPPSLATPLGRRIKNMRLAGRLLGELPRGPGASLSETLEIWRDGGGTVEVDQLVLSHGPLTLRTDGTLALDRDLQPVGAFTARMQGFFETIDAFSGAGMIGPGQAVSAKLLLGVFSRRPKNGGPATLNVALTVQQRNLYAGPVKLLRLPLVRWQ